MEGFGAVLSVLAGISIAAVLVYLFWRYIWFFRNPERRIPQGEDILCPADSTVVYVKHVAPGEPIITIKKERAIRIHEIVGKELKGFRLLIGVFMSPFDVHYNRAPTSGKLTSVRHHPAVVRNHHMGSMHWRALRGRHPIYENSPHIVQNERTVTRIEGLFRNEPVSCDLVQIAGGSVSGIESYVREGKSIERGEIFGMIRIGSQVDLVVTWRESMTVRVKPGDRVRAGETVFID